jgi:Zn-dependent protease with chaperone function
MHLTMLLSIVALAWLWRYLGVSTPTGNWQERWQHTLAVLLLPPLLLMGSSIAILKMGPHGWMVWGWEGWVSYWLASAFLSLMAFSLIRMLIAGCQTSQQVRSYRQIELYGQSVRVLDATIPYSAQIGFWQPDLLVSQGLIDTLDSDHLQAVLAHEQAHYYYRDTFWFFWLAWLRQITIWLPNSQVIWEDLLALRELRADRWAAQTIDSLLLAETLLLVVQHITAFEDSYSAAFNHMASPDRLTQRIEALVMPVELLEPASWWQWGWLLVPLLPLLIVPLHK